MADQPLHGKTILITGAARRLGRAFALACAHAGADIVIYHGNSERLSLQHDSEKMQGRQIMKALIVFYSMYGHVYKMAEAVAGGVSEIEGATAELRRVAETLSEEILKKMGAIEPQKSFSHIPVCHVDELPEADALIFGTPTRFGNMCG